MDYSTVATKPSGQDFEKEVISEGTHNAIFCAVYGLGYQEGEYKGEKNVKQKVAICWEVDEPRESGNFAGERKRKSKIYNLSLSEKSTLYAHLKGLIGSGLTDEYDLADLIGHPCQITIAHEHKDGKIYDNINSISKLMKGVTPLDIKGDYAEIPEWITKMREESINPDDMPINASQKNALEIALKHNQSVLVKSLVKFGFNVANYHNMNTEDAKGVIMDYNAQLDSLAGKQVNPDDIPF